MAVNHPGGCVAYKFIETDKEGKTKTFVFCSDFEPDEKTKKLLRGLVEGRLRDDLLKELGITEGQYGWLLEGFLGVRNRTEASLMAIVNGWVTEVRFTQQFYSTYRYRITDDQLAFARGLVQECSYSKLASRIGGSRSRFKRLTVQFFQRVGLNKTK